MQKKLKIAINGRFLNKPYTGIGRYSFELIKELSKICGTQVELIVICEAQIMKPWSEVLKRFRNIQIVVKIENRFFYLINKGFAKTCWEACTFYKIARKNKVDMIFCPYPSALKRKKIPMVVTVHDVIPWLDSQYHSASFLGSIYNKITLKYFKTVDRILTVSNFSKKQIEKIAPELKAKISVTYNGIDDVFSQQIQNPKAILKKYGVPSEKGFLFYYGGFDKRKNVSRLVRIYNNYLKKEIDLNLLLGGGKILDNHLFENMMKLEGKGIILSGFIAEEDLPTFLQESVAFINLSRYEGFNLPLAEALTAGCVSIVSNIAVNNEVGKEYPFFINLKQSDKEIAQQIISVLCNHKNYSEQRQKMQSYKNKFSWENTAKNTWEVFQEVI